MDFAAWAPYGRRQQRVLKYIAVVFSGRTLQPKLLGGPNTFFMWRRCQGPEIMFTIMLPLKSGFTGKSKKSWAFAEIVRSQVKEFGRQKNTTCQGTT